MSKPAKQINERAKLTIRTIEAIKPKDREYIIWDTELSSFGLRVKPSGVMNLFIQYRNSGGRTRKYKLGRVGVIAPEKARVKAKKLFAEIADGADPSAERKRMRIAPTMAELAERYVAEYVKPNKKPAGADQDKRNIRVHILPALGKRRKVASITRQDVMKMHAGLGHTPAAANRARAVLSKMMELAEVWGMRPDGSNPCRHVKKYPESKRERFLSAKEFARLGAALSKVERQAIESPTAIAAIRLLVFTGCRRGEILGLRWDEVDWERQCLRLTDSKTGPKIVHLNAPALEVLNGIERRDDTPFVIPGRNPGEPLTDLKGPWQRIREKAKLTDVRLHDLRHSYASVAAVSGQSLLMIGTLLGHTQIETTERYAHLAADPIKAANEAIGRQIADAMKGGGKDGAEVVELSNQQR